MKGVAMKKAILTVTVLIVMGWALLAYPQQAYEFVRADIPFDFQVSGQTLTAGRYDFCWNRAFVAAVKLADKSASSPHPIQYVTIMGIDQPSKGTKAMVVFHRLGNSYFLSEIHQPGSGRVTVTISPQERNLNRLATTKVDVQAESGK
jgi:hypothetical protein